MIRQIDLIITAYVLYLFPPVKWPVLVGYPIVSFLFIAGLGIILHVKWLELQIIYKSHFQHGKHDEGQSADYIEMIFVLHSSDSAQKCICQESI